MAKNTVRVSQENIDKLNELVNDVEYLASEIAAGNGDEKIVLHEDEEDDDEGLAPTWTSKDGKTKLLSEMKTGNLRAIAKNMQENDVDGVFSGVYEALVAELADRGEYVD